MLLVVFPCFVQLTLNVIIAHNVNWIHGIQFSDFVSHCVPRWRPTLRLCVRAAATSVCTFTSPACVWIVMRGRRRSLALANDMVAPLFWQRSCTIHRGYAQRPSMWAFTALVCGASWATKKEVFQFCASILLQTIMSCGAQRARGSSPRSISFRRSTGAGFRGFSSLVNTE